MTCVIPPAAAAAHVARMSDLDPVPATAVLCLRGLGCDSFDLTETLSRRFGKANADHLIARCDDVASFMARYGRRPLVRHTPTCPGLGADEAVFAQIITLALTADREDVMMMAMLICRADLAPCVVPLIEAFALTIQRAHLPARARQLH